MNENRNQNCLTFDCVQEIYRISEAVNKFVSIRQLDICLSNSLRAHVRRRVSIRVSHCDPVGSGVNLFRQLEALFH